MRIIKDVIWGVESGKELHDLEIRADSSESSNLPTDGVLDGSICTYTDNGKVLFFNEKTSAWIEQFSLQS